MTTNILNNFYLMVMDVNILWNCFNWSVPLDKKSIRRDLELEISHAAARDAVVATIEPYDTTFWWKHLESMQLKLETFTGDFYFFKVPINQNYDINNLTSLTMILPWNEDWKIKSLRPTYNSTLLELCIFYSIEILEQTQINMASFKAF